MLQRFEGLGRGRPCIRGLTSVAERGTGGGKREYVELTWPEDVMEVVMAIIRGNCEGSPSPPPAGRLQRERH